METALIVALIGLGGVISGVVSGFVTTSRSLYINSITVERNKWLEKLRSNIAAFATEARAISLEMAFDEKKKKDWEKVCEDIDPSEEMLPPMPVLETTSKLIAHFRKIQELSYTLQLQLNPAGVIDRQIIRILTSGGINNPRDMRRMTRTAKILVLHSQWLLKAEWEKVKFEGGSPWYRWKHRQDEAKREAAYLEWVEGPGSLTPLQQALEDEPESKRIEPPATGS